MQLRVRRTRQTALLVASVLLSALWLTTHWLQPRLGEHHLSLQASPHMHMNSSSSSNSPGDAGSWSAPGQAAAAAVVATSNTSNNSSSVHQPVLLLNSTSTSSNSSTGHAQASGTRGQGQAAGSTYAHNLLARAQAEQQRARDPAYMAKLRAAVATPINVVIMSGLFWTMANTHVQDCSVHGVPLDCRFSLDPNNETALDTADALYYHLPSFSGQPRAKAFPTQLRLAMSLESSAYYAHLDDPGFMCQFDAEMTYRHCAQVTNWYSLEALDGLFDGKIPRLPFEEKLHAIAYVNSNCEAQTGRSDIMRALIAMGDTTKVPVHSLGRCDRNKEWPDGDPSKTAVFSRYKFCVTMENSLRQDYVTEKLWDGLVGGCVPVYLGSSSARDMVPDPNSFIRYDASGNGDASTPEELDALMHAIGSNKTHYEAMTAWQQRQPEEQPNPLFRHLWSMRHTGGECMLCQFLARHRVEPQEHYQTCLFNKDWMATANQTYISKQQACQQPRRS